MTKLEKEFLKAHKKRWFIRHANMIIVGAGTFHTRKQAKSWAEWNYKGRTNWTIERL